MESCDRDFIKTTFLLWKAMTRQRYDFIKNIFNCLYQLKLSHHHINASIEILQYQQIIHLLATVKYAFLTICFFLSILHRALDTTFFSCCVFL